MDYNIFIGASFDGGERVDVVGGAYSVTSLFASHRPRCALCSRCGDCVGHALSGDASRASTSLRCLRRPRAVANRRGSYECRPASRTNGLRPKGSPSPLTALVSLATRGALWVELGVGRGRVNYNFFIGASFDGGGGGYGGRGVRIAVRTRGKLELRVQPEMQVLRGCGHGEGCRCCAMHSVKNRPVPGRSGIVPGTGRVLWESRFKEWGIRKPANGRRTPGKLSALRRCAYLRCACSRCSRWCRC